MSRKTSIGEQFAYPEGSPDDFQHELERQEQLQGALHRERHLLRVQSKEENRVVTRDRINDIKRQLHILAEGNGVANDNADGCYYCGSPHHHSTDCRDRD